MSEETYYSKNREKYLAKAKEYRNAHKENYQAYWKEYYLKHKAELLKKRAEYARKHKETIYQKNRTVYYPRHQAKKKGEVVEPLPPSVPTPRSVPVEVPPLPPIVISRGIHTVSFD